MPDPIVKDSLNPEKRQQLDSNIKMMLEKGASKEDVMSYASDFKNKFALKKKDDSQSTVQNQELVSDQKEETGSLGGLNLNNDFSWKETGSSQEVLNPKKQEKNDLYNRYSQASQLKEDQLEQIDRDLETQKRMNFFKNSSAAKLFGVSGSSAFETGKSRKQLEEDYKYRNQEEFFETLSKSELTELQQQEYKKIENLNTKNKSRVWENNSLNEQRSVIDKEISLLSKSMYSAIQNGVSPNQAAYDKLNELESAKNELGQKMNQNISDYEKSQEDLQGFSEELDLFKSNWGLWESTKKSIGLAGAEGLLGVAKVVSDLLPNEIKPIANTFNDKINKTLNIVEQEKSFIRKSKSINDVKNFEDFGEFFVETLGEQAIPLVAAASGTGGVAYLGASSFGGKKSELEREILFDGKNYSQSQILLASTSSAIFDTAGALVDRYAMMKGARALKAGISSGGKKAIESGVSKYLKPIAAEQTEEVSALLGGQIVDYYGLDKKDTKIGADLANTIAKTGITVGLINTVPTVVGDAMGIYHTRQKKAKIQENLQVISKMQEQLDNNQENLSGVERNAITSIIDKTSQENLILLKDTAKVINGLSDNNREKVSLLDSEINDSKKSIVEINESEKIDTEAKEKLIENFTEKIEIKETQKEEILNKDTNQSETTQTKNEIESIEDTPSPTVELNPENTTEVSNESIETSNTDNSIVENNEIVDIEKRRKEELSKRQGKFDPKLSSSPKSKSSNEILERKAQQAEKEISKLREEDGSITKENLPKFKELQKKITKLRKGESESKEDILKRLEGKSIADILFSTFSGSSTLKDNEQIILTELLLKEGFTQEEINYLFKDKDNIQQIKERFFEVSKTKINAKYDKLAEISKTNETAPAQDTTTDGGVQSGTDTNIQQGQNNVSQSTVELEANTAEVQPTTVKRINPKGVKGEFDVEIDENGSVKSIKSKDGREVPKFVDRKVKKTKQNPRGLKAVKNANYSRIEAEAIGGKTENAIREEEAKATNDAVSSFEPTNEYEAALKYMAEGGRVKLSDAVSQGQGVKGSKWASGFNKETDLPSIERASEIITENLGLDNIDQQVVRDELESIVRENSSIDDVRKKLVDLRNKKEIESQEAELNAYLNSLSPQDFAKFEAIEAEENYFSELNDKEIIEYLEEEYGRQGQQAIEDDTNATTENSGVQERTGEESEESNTTTKQEQSKIDSLYENLKKWDEELKKFGDETLGINLPIAVARTAVKAMMIAAKTAKKFSEVIKAGVDAIQKTNWYSKLTDAEKADINEATIQQLIKDAVDETNNISNEDARDLYEKSVEKADKALEGNKTSKQKRKELVRKAIELYSDRQFVPKKLMDEIGAQSVKDLMINSHGASGKAKRFFEDSYDKIYNKLSTKDRKSLDKIIQLRRIITIDENRFTKDLPEVSHPDGMDLVKAKKVLEQYKSDFGDKKFNDLDARATEYFKTYQKILDDTLNSGLISQATYDKLNGLDYQPRLFIQHITDFEGNVSLGSKSSDRSDTGGLSGADIIKTLEEGSEGSLINNSEWLLATTVVARARAIAMNNTNKQFIKKEFPKAKARFEKLKSDIKNKKNWTKEDVRFFEYFKELDSKVKTNDIVGYKKVKVKKGADPDPNTLLGDTGNSLATKQDIKNGEFTEIEVPIYRYDKTPRNFKKAYWYENGVRNEFFLEEGFHDQWFDNFSRLPGSWKEIISYGSGSALIKGIATGNNPAFAIVNTPRDFMFTAVFSDQYSSIVPKAMAQVARDTFKAIKEIKKSGKGSSPNNLFQKYIEYGGDMAFLSTQGRLKKNTELGKILDKSISKRTRDIGKGIFDAVTLKKLSNYSEIMFRMALFSRTIKNELKELGYSDISDVKELLDSNGDVIESKQDRIDRIYNRGVAEARSLLDFNQGGRVVKDLESLIPYLNTSVQGTRVAADAFAKNPAMVASKVLQTAGLMSTAVVGFSIALIYAFKSEDDEDKSSMEILLDGYDGISQYQKLQYFNFVTPFKNKEGERVIWKVAKNQTMAPIFAFSDNILNIFISGIIGRERKSTKLVYEDVKMAFNNNIMPVDISSPAGVLTRNPVMKSVLTYTTGYDFYRDEPLSNDIGKVEKGAEGQTSSNIDDFYKEIGISSGLSASRLKGATEALITTPNTNPFIGMLYSGAEYATTDKDLKAASKEFAKNFGKSITKRMVSHTSDFNRSFNKNKEYAEEEAKLRLENDLRNIDIKSIANKKYSKEISAEDFKEKTKDFSAKEKQKLFNRVADLTRLSKVVDRNIIDIKYEDNAKVRALMILNRYGDIFDGSQDSQKILKQMSLAKGVLTPDVMLEYNKIKKKIKKTNSK